MSEKRFIQEFLDITGCTGQSDYHFLRNKANFYNNENSNEFFAKLEKAMNEADRFKIKEKQCIPLEECLMYYYELEMLEEKPHSNLYTQIKQKYYQYKYEEISVFSYYMFLLGLAVSGKILANKHIYENIYTVYERLCGKHKTLEKIRQWNYYDAVQFEYDDDAEADRNIILTRDIKSQMKRIQKSINHYLQENSMAEITIPRQNCSKQLDDCTKYVLYYALKYLVKDELYNLYPEKNRSKPHKLITLLNIFFHNNGDYSFSEAPTMQETQPVYDKKVFLKEYSFPQNGYMVKLIEKNNRNNKSVYVVGKDVLLEHSEYFKDIFESENIFYFVVTRYTKTFSKQFYELQENEKGNFNDWVEDILNESEKITTDFDIAYMYLDDMTGSEEEIYAKIQEKQHKLSNREA